LVILTVSWTVCPGWPQTSILSISASQVARITGMTHIWCPAKTWFLRRVDVHWSALGMHWLHTWWREMRPQKACIIQINSYRELIILKELIIFTQGYSSW
jgi:hypothetical protein